MHPLLKSHILFYSNGLAIYSINGVGIVSGFHDISQNILVLYADVIN